MAFEELEVVADCNESTSGQAVIVCSREGKGFLLLLHFKHHVINIAELHQLRCAHAAVAPEAGSAAYPNAFSICHKTPTKIRFA